MVFTINKSTALLGLAVIGVVIAGVLIFANNNTGGFNFSGILGRSSDKVAQKAIDYINDNGISELPASLVSSSEESGVVKIKIKIGANEFDSYVTKDGKYLFPQVIDMGGAEEKEGNSDQSAKGQSQESGLQEFSITDNDHVLGDFNAQITFVEFSDFECPYCGKHMPTIKRVLSDYKDEVRVVFKHFPLSGHPNAQKAAEASECASEQGKFWEYHDVLFENQTNGFSVDKFKNWAAGLKLNTSQFNNCLDSSKYADKVAADMNEGVAKGVNGTPATFINGELVSGAVPYETFKAKIDSLLE